MVKFEESSNLHRQLVEVYGNTQNQRFIWEMMSVVVTKNLKLPLIVKSKTSGGEYVVEPDINALHDRLMAYLAGKKLGKVSKIINKTGSPYYLDSYLLLIDVRDTDKYLKTLENLYVDQPLLYVKTFRRSVGQHVLAVNAKCLVSIIIEKLNSLSCVEYVQRNQIFSPNIEEIF